MFSKDELAPVIDHTCLYSDATSEDIQKLEQEAEEYGFGAVCVYPADIRYLDGDGTNICSVVGFPSGRTPSELKSAETEYALAKGAEEIDVVINQGYIKEDNLEKAVQDLEAVTQVAEQSEEETTVKVICENCNLSEDEKVAAYRAAEAAGADFIKTSTGFGEHGARPEDIELMAETIEDVDSDMGIKASGGIGTLREAERMFKASGMPLDPEYFRIGASSSVDIMEEF